jgi:hypothetical protein
MVVPATIKISFTIGFTPLGSEGNQPLFKYI